MPDGIPPRIKLTPTLALGPVRLDLMTRRASVDGRHVNLSAIEFGMLEALVLNRGRVVATAKLADLPYRALAKRMRAICAALHDAGAPDMIAWVRGAGYVAREPEA